MPHKTELHPDVIDRILKRRGKMHVHDTIDPRRTALVSIDMQVAFLGEGLPSEVPMARDIVPNINRLAAAMRARGGTVVWVYSTFTPETVKEWSSFFGGTYGGPHAAKVAENLFAGSPGHKHWPAVETKPGDLWVDKNRFSAFLPGASDIEAQLKKLGEQNIKGLILDLRNNPGGLLNEGVAVSDHFLRKGQTIVSHRGRASAEKPYVTRRGNSGHDYPIVVLVNRYSASAAEIQ